MTQLDAHGTAGFAGSFTESHRWELATTAYSVRYRWLSERATEPVSLHLFDTRSRTALLRAKVRTWGDLALLSDYAIGSLPHIGSLTVQRINQVLAAVTPAPQHSSVNTSPEGPSSSDSDSWVSTLTASAEWAAVVAGATTLGELLKAAQSAAELPDEVRTELAGLMAIELPGSTAMSLASRLDQLLGEARDPVLFAARELSSNPPTLEALAAERGLTRERIRQKVASDVDRMRSMLDTGGFRSLRWAVERFKADLGMIADVNSNAVAAWSQQCGSERFEMLRWLAGYTERDGLLLRTPDAVERVTAAIDRSLDGEWLLSKDSVASLVPEDCDPLVVIRHILESGRWRDIGDGWLVRWDGPLQVKAERILRLTCVPMTPAELIAAIGHGSEGALKNQRGDRLVRIDKQFRLALPEWGFEEYEGIVAEMRQRIERGGGVARVSEIVDEFTRSFGVSVTSIETYLSLPMFDVSGDLVRLGDDLSFAPRSPATTQGAVETEAGWGERHIVTENVYRGYSFGLNPHVCWANGLRPGDDLLVPINGSSLMASVIWRTTNLSGTVDVGRVREWLLSHGAPIGSEVLVCPTRASVTILAGTGQIQAAQQEFEAKAPALSPDIASLMEGL